MNGKEKNKEGEKNLRGTSGSDVENKSVEDSHG